MGALVTGAYDTTTWGDDGPLFTDDPTHLPGAQFWIPTLDEWMKAARYDPNRFGDGQGGWWMYAGMSDVPLISGAPGEGQTSAGFHTELDPFAEWDIPLGAYPDIMSAYGLWDISGGASEWTEGFLFEGFPRDRILGGSYAGDSNYLINDHASVITSLWPGTGASNAGLRIASIPAAPSAPVLLISALFLRRRR
ncbi:MAG: SUMF1/EgtB/PvdO family nonheme iron enzyme [Phycisphaerales bacterium]|nr:SUMF1/EgtB/PvdO family nonheme iron enzyme [Phycisphaerales bacterium]